MSLKGKPQPLNTFFSQNVEPFQKSSITLSGGFDRPYYYSLGNQSTVPFVRFQGSGGTQKEFTWGETIEVMPGQNIQVESASYMAGDIQIQSGRDIANRPARITVPIKTLPDNPLSLDSSNNNLRPVFPCDCRGARRAYLAGLISTTSEDPDFADHGSFGVIGLNKQHSWPGFVDAGYLTADPPGKKYFSLFHFNSNTTYSMLPLGYMAHVEDPTTPMTLADYVIWQLQVFTNITVRAPFFYTLEYL